MSVSLSPLPHTVNDPEENAFNRMVSENLDPLLVRYAKANERFTVCEVRDRLLKVPDLEQACPKALRFRVRDRIKTLKQQGLVHQVGHQGKRRPVYQLSLAESATAADTTAIETGAADTDTNTDTSAAFADYLERECHRLKLDMQAALGEATHYDHILTHYPERRPLIKPLHEAACQRGSEVKGALDAVVKLRQSLAEEAHA